MPIDVFKVKDKHLEFLFFNFELATLILTMVMKKFIRKTISQICLILNKT